MTYTTNFELKKPGDNDFYDIGDHNDNMDVIDEAMGDFYEELEDKQGKAITTTVTITVANWSGGTTCTKSVTGVTSSNIVIVESSNALVSCSGQGSGTLTFTAVSTPTSTTTVKVVIIP